MENLLLIAVLLIGIMVLGSSSINDCIRLVAAHGIILGGLLVVHADALSLHVVALSVMTIVLKGVAMPFLLLRSIRAARVEREVDPYVGYTRSIVMGTIAVAVAFWLARALPLPYSTNSAVIVPVSLATVFLGLLLLVTRKKAVTQVLGYLVMENGILLFGLSLGASMPTLIEMGVLLDVFVAVFIMGIAIYQISREFDNIDANAMSALNDLQDNRRWLVAIRNGHSRPPRAGR